MSDPQERLIAELVKGAAAEQIRGAFDDGVNAGFKMAQKTCRELAATLPDDWARGLLLYADVLRDQPPFSTEEGT